MTRAPLPPPASRSGHASTETHPTRLTTHDIARLGHELRNPLTSLQGALDLLAAEILGPVPKPLQQLIASAQQNSHHFTDLLAAYLQAPAPTAHPAYSRANSRTSRSICTGFCR